MALKTSHYQRQILLAVSSMSMVAALAAMTILQWLPNAAGQAVYVTKTLSATLGLSTRAVSSTPTDVWPPAPQPTQDPVVVAATYAADFNRMTDMYGIDFQCAPPCWKGGQPGTTSMSDVFRHLDSLSIVPSGRKMSDYRADRAAPNNTIALIGSGSPTLVLYTDSAAPAPRLRAYTIGLGRRAFTPNTQLNTEILRWFSSTILTRLEPPKAVFSSSLPPMMVVGLEDRKRYYLLYDYGGWAIEYFGLSGTRSTSVVAEVCVENELAAHIWKYAPTEGSAVDLLRSLNTYGTYQETRIQMPDKLY